MRAGLGWIVESPSFPARMCRAGVVVESGRSACCDETRRFRCEEKKKAERALSLRRAMREKGDRREGATGR